MTQKSASDTEHVRIEDIVDLPKEANRMENRKLLNQLVDLVVLDHRKNGPLLFVKVTNESLGDILKSLLVDHF